MPHQPCFSSHIFAVPKSSGGHRLILDVSRLNDFILTPTFKMTNQKHLMLLLKPDSWMTTIDIREAYLHVPIRVCLQKFLALTCRGKLFFFRALPFGLAPAPWVYTAIMKFPLATLHQAGTNALAYIDDLILWAQSKDQAQAQTQQAVSVLTDLGFLLNLKKSTLTPTQKVTWLGLEWNSLRATVSIPFAYAEEIRAKAANLLQRQVCTRRELEQLTGKIAFAAQVCPRARHLLHSLAKPQLLGPLRDIPRRIPGSLLRELPQWVSAPFLDPPRSLILPPVKRTVWTDASLFGWGAISSHGHIWQGKWSPQEATEHINVLELRTVRLVLQKWGLSRAHLRVHTDNVCTRAAIANLGSPAPKVQLETVPLVDLAEKRQVHLEAFHIPGELNVAADALSRNTPIEAEWSLPQSEFQRLVGLHGASPQVDLFASPLNARLQCFLAPFGHPFAAGVDAFSTDWDQWSQLYLFPPDNLLPKALQKLEGYEGGVLLIARLRPAAPWFAGLVARGTRLPLQAGPVQRVQDRVVKATSWVPSAAWIGISFSPGSWKSHTRPR